MTEPVCVVLGASLTSLKRVFRTVSITSDRHIEVQGFTGGNVNKVYKHKPVALVSGFVSLAPSSVTSDISSLSDKKIKDNCIEFRE